MSGEQLEQNDPYLPGFKDKNGEEIEEIYYKFPGEFVVYRCKGPALCYWRYDGWDKDISAISEQVGNLYSIIEKFNGDKSNYYPRIAAAVSECLKGNDEIGIRIIKHLIKSANSTLEHKSKIWYFISCLGFVLFINLIGILVIYKYGWNETKAMITMCGSLGGFISVATGLDKIKIDTDAGIFTNCFFGLARIMLAVFFAFIIYVAIKSNIILGNVADNVYALYLFSILGGFSETMVPNILRGLEKKVKTEENL